MSFLTLFQVSSMNYVCIITCTYLPRAIVIFPAADHQVTQFQYYILFPDSNGGFPYKQQFYYILTIFTFLKNHIL